MAFLSDEALNQLVAKLIEGGFFTLGTLFGVVVVLSVHRFLRKNSPECSWEKTATAYQRENQSLRSKMTKQDKDHFELKAEIANLKHENETLRRKKS